MLKEKIAWETFCQGFAHLGLIIGKSTNTKINLLHDVSPRESGKVAKSIGAVDDRVGRRHFRVAQYKVAVWEGDLFINFFWYLILSLLIFLYASIQLGAPEALPS